jgi:uncharacterized protein DUF2779
MAGLSKSRILLQLQCPKRLWLQVYRPELAVVETGTAARLAAGNEVGDVARSLYPDGVLIEPGDLGQALAQTEAALRDAPRPLFEATFQVDGVLIRADLLLPDAGGFRMAEVKSSTGVKDYHLADAAIQAWVCRQAGLPISGVEIAHIDTGFVYPGNGDYRGLFAHADVTPRIADLASEVPAWIAASRTTLRGPEPDTAPGSQCGDPFDCPFLGHCCPAPDPSAYPPEILPHGGAIAARLRAQGVTDLREVGEEQFDKPRHRRVWRASVTGRMELDPEAAEILAALTYPRHYLDFETIQFAVPRWAGTRPYAQIPFQWSCHVEDGQGGLEHREFLADGSADPRRAFADTLVAALGDSGPIVVYNAGFERGRMRELAAAFPDFAPALNSAIERIVDLLPIARNHYYHPAMRGSWSIKAVLPTIAPELSYDGLEVAHGGMAQEAFMEILDPATPTERRRHLHAALLAYCERDTLAMVRIAHHFEQRA